MADEQIAEARGPDSRPDLGDRATPSLPSHPRWKDTEAMGILLAAAEAFNDPLSTTNKIAIVVGASSHGIVVSGLMQGWRSAKPDIFADPHPVEKEKLRRGKLRRAHRDLIFADVMLYLAVGAGVGGAGLCAVLSAWIGTVVFAALPGPAYVAYRRLTKSAEDNERGAHESDQKAIELSLAKADLELRHLEIREKSQELAIRQKRAIRELDMRSPTVGEASFTTTPEVVPPEV